MFRQKIPLYYLLIAIFSGIALTYLIYRALDKKMDNYKSLVASNLSTGHGCDYDFARLPGYKHIRPLVMVRPSCESEKYSAIKEKLSDLLRGYTSSGVLTSASFDLRDLKTGDWISYNGDERFSPGSLMKVPVMITILRMAENSPGLLERQVVYQVPFRKDFTPRFNDDMIIPGHTYTIRQLLQRMIQNSDNDAASLLCQNIDTIAFKKIFTDFGFRAGSLNEIYPITCIEFSAYMEMLYNAGYLTIDDSEYATSLLASTNFKMGMVKGLPDSVQVVHKFGESGDAQMAQLHESGIVYYGDSPYLLTVMTRGHDINKLPEVISAVSGLVYTEISNTGKSGRIAQNGIASH